MISILIATKDRPEQLSACLTSIVKNTYKNFEIIVIDQSGNTKTYKPNTKLQTNTISYYKKNFNGKSAALNFGLNNAKGDIIAFTDDDCIVSDHWMKEVASTFRKHPSVASITGNTYPYDTIPSRACPPTLATPFNIFTKPTYHAIVGFGNNYAIRKSVLDAIGYFKPWLGPGSITTACEDGEIIVRILTREYKILHNPNMIVYHNKKLNKSTLKIQNLSYICGEMACYEYYALSGYTFAQNVINNNLMDSVCDIRRIFGNMVKRKTGNPDDLKYSVMKAITRIKGLSIGLRYFIKEVVLGCKDTAGLTQ